VRIGIDSYSYHRLLGELRAGEVPAAERFAAGDLDPIREARALGVDGVSLETCFLKPPDRLDTAALAGAAGPLEVVFAWGAPNGLAFGHDEAALPALHAWLTLAASLGHRVMRIVVGGPSLRGREPVADQLERVAPPLSEAARLAETAGVTLALENHGDLTAGELDSLLGRVGSPALGVCFDAANALRVGDDPVAAVHLLLPAIHMVHLRDSGPPEGVDPVAGPPSVPYGTGVVPIDGVLRALAAGGFDGLVCAEVAQVAPGVDERVLVAEYVGWLREHG